MTTASNLNLAAKRLNVLVYSGNGTTVDSVRQCLFTLRRLLSSNYAVIPVTSEMVVKEPWTASCALFVMPGGADLPYCKTLNGEGNRRISQFVNRGGAYLGFCAGGYYGSKRCEFEVGDKKMEVVGDRELAFFPGTCRGCAFPGFVYDSEAGSRAAELNVSKTALSSGNVPDIFKSYYNGGGVFVDAPKYADQGVEVLANYTEPLNVDSGEGTAAVVYCRVGQGSAILTGPHPEFASTNLDRNADVPAFSGVIDTLAGHDTPRTNFLKACLEKLGLQVNQEITTVPALSRLHLSAQEPGDAAKLIASIRELIVIEDGNEYLKDDNDKFQIEKLSSLNLDDLAASLPASTKQKTNQGGATEDRIVDYNSIIKPMVLHEDIPESKLTPYFNHPEFYAYLKEFQSQSKEALQHFGSHILYGEVVTSTNTILEKNTQLLRRLPTGFTATCTTQVAGRGRGSNVWVSPAGTVPFSVVIRHPMALMESAPVVFVQYLVGMAMVKAIKTYGPGYEQMPVKLKWPNDIYALDPTDPTGKNYTKIGGILVNAHFSSDEYIAVVGAGVNTHNSAPTTSLNKILSTLPPSVARETPLSRERLLARMLSVFDAYYARFIRTGFDREFEDLYYADWLHMDQIVTLEAEGGVRARIKGITRDYGLLVAEELGWEDRPTGRKWELQSDSNSFDFFRGLVRRKM